MLKNKLRAGLIKKNRKRARYLSGQHHYLAGAQFDLVQDALSRKKRLIKTIAFSLSFAAWLIAEAVRVKLSGRQRAAFITAARLPIADRNPSVKSLRPGLFRDSQKLRFKETTCYGKILENRSKETESLEETRRKETLSLMVWAMRSRLSKLTDTFIDGSIEKLFIERNSFVLEEQRLKAELLKLNDKLMML